jgi:hypothetical protein
MKYVLPLLLALLPAAGCKKAPVTASEVIVVQVGQLPGSPGDSGWEGAPEYVAKLIPQDLVEPRLAQASTAEVHVQALTNGREIAFRLRWADADQNDTAAPGKFVDACAVQVPVKRMANPPAPQMGESGGAVQIAYWRADWQAWVNGRADDIKSIYPNAEVSHWRRDHPNKKRPRSATPRRKPSAIAARERGSRRSKVCWRKVRELCRPIQHWR